MNLEELGIPYTVLGENKEIDLFWHISQSLVSKSDLQEILQLIVTMTAHVMGSKICSLMLYDERRNELSISASQALSQEYLNKPNIKIGESISGRALKERRPVWVPDVTKDKSFQFPEIARKNGLISLLSVPMVIAERSIGVINSYKKEPHEFTDVEIKILQSVANQAAIAIENAKLRQENLDTKRELEERKVLDRAKALLMEKDGLKEEEAYELLQKTGRDKRITMIEVAKAIILAYPLRKA
jgi:GAF domain-containing protein